MDQHLVEVAGHLRALKVSEGGKLLLAFIAQKQQDGFAQLRESIKAQKTGKAATIAIAKSEAFEEVVAFIEDAIRYGEQEQGKI